jgi:hypothetical protein
MRKLLSVALINVVLGINAFASGNITYLGQKEKTLSLQVKHIDIKDSGLDSGVIYGLSYMINKDVGQVGAWGMRYGFEFNYGKLDFSDSSGDTTYTEFSWTIAPSYTFNCGARAYAGGKVGYVGFSNSVVGSGGTNGYVLAGVVGAEYPVMKHMVVGAEVEAGNTYIESQSYSTTTFGGYVGYKF